MLNHVLDPNQHAQHECLQQSADSGNKEGFHYMKEILADRAWVRVFVGGGSNLALLLAASAYVSEVRGHLLCRDGGDGTVMWVVEEAQLHNINPQNMHIGMVPLGTGNGTDKALPIACV